MRYAMKKLILVFSSLLCVELFFACSTTPPPTSQFVDDWIGLFLSVTKSYGVVRTYYLGSDAEWSYFKCSGDSPKYRKVETSRMSLPRRFPFLQGTPYRIRELDFGSRFLQTAHDSGLAVWRSPGASTQQQADAASRLIPKGTKQAEVERVLGEPTRRARFYGPVIYAPGYVGPTNATYSDVWCDYYDLGGGGYVRLTFDVEASRSKWEDRPLIDISPGNTNDETVKVVPR